MAEVYLPRIKVQSAVIPATKCQLCEINDIQFKCFTCDECTYMCNTCKIAHKKSQFTRDHKITSTKGADQQEEEETSDGGDNKCRLHPSEDSVMFCKECRFSICMECIASGSHQHHKLIKIQDMINEKQKDLSNIIDKANEKLSISENKIKSIGTMIDKNSEDVNECIEKVRARNVQLKSMLDQITSEVITQLQSKEKQTQELLRREENITNSDISKLKEIINNCMERRKTKDAEIFRFVTDVRNKLDQLQLSDIPSQPSLPVFVTKDIDIQKLRILFGELDTEDDKSSNFEETTGIFPTHTKPTLHVKAMSTFTMKDKDLLAVVSDTQAWIGKWNSKDISLVTSDEVIQTVKTDFSIHDMAVTTAGEVLVTECFGNKVKKVTSNGKFTDVYVAPEGQKTQGIAVTDDNHIIVCLYASNKEPSKLVQLSPTGEVLQTIQYDSTDGETPLFDNAWSVSCNRNGDIIAISNDDVIAVDKTGCKRFVYRGEVKGLKKPFNPQYTGTDKYGHILISDYYNNAVHLLDSNGHFLKFVLTNKHQLNGPRGMSIDKSGKLWICSYGNDKIIKLKYL